MSGELEMAEFAADLYDVAEGRGGSVYRDPSRFSLTYPTHDLRDLVRNVSLRLAGKGTKAVHQINVTFGGGKTHALITLYHLANDPATLPQVDAVDEFRQHAGTDFTRARVILLPFDKIDIARGWTRVHLLVKHDAGCNLGRSSPTSLPATTECAAFTAAANEENDTACGADHHRLAPPRHRRGRRGARADRRTTDVRANPRRCR
jgi:hypothetical protein